MSTDGRKLPGGVPRPGRANGFIPTSFRALSSYLRIVSSGASTVASTVRSAASAASAILDKDSDAGHDQVRWAGFDKLECKGDVSRQVLLLGFRSGFQVWDVEEADNVVDIVSRHDGPVSYIQMLPKPIASKAYKDKFADSRPLLIICADGSFSGGSYVQDGSAIPFNGCSQSSNGSVNGVLVPTMVWFYSLSSQSYVHVIKFRSAVYMVRCSSRVIAVLQAAQIHCFDAATLDREYTIVTNPVPISCSGSGGFGYGPLAVGSRWLAYSGNPVAVSNTGDTNSQHLSPSSFPDSALNGSLAESSKQLADEVVTLGDMGFKKQSRYYYELIPDGNNQSDGLGLKVNCHLLDEDNVGMVIVRDIVRKSVIAQFKSHKSPISSLCFDPSGTVLVTASVQGHNINVFRIMPGSYRSNSGSCSNASYAHLYRLQRGFTNAVIQDICFSDDSHWIMITSSRGTGHLFAISPLGGSVNSPSPDAGGTNKNSASHAMTKPASCLPPNSCPHMFNQQSFCAYGPPITLSAVNRIRNGNSGWRCTASGAAAAATGRMNSLSGAIASAFHNCKGNDFYVDARSLKAKYHLMVFSPSGCMIQYAFRTSSGLDSARIVSGLSSTCESATDGDIRLVIEAVQKWNICQKQSRREQEDNIDIYGDHRNSDSSKIFPEQMARESSCEARGRVTAAHISPEERRRVFVSEAELQLDRPRIPLWAKSAIYFQSMIIDDTEQDGENDLGGEIEIERIPTRTIEARSKKLLPVSDCLQTPNFAHERMSASDGNDGVQLRHQMCGEGYSDPMTKRGVVVDEHYKETNEGFVDNGGSPESHTKFEIVNNRVLNRCPN